MARWRVQRRVALVVAVAAGALCALLALWTWDSILDAWWTHQLRSGNYIDRMMAAKRLGVRRSSGAVPRLVERLVAEATTPPPAPDCRCTGTRDAFHYTPAHVYHDAILEVGLPAVAELRRVLETGSAEARVWAAHLLGSIVVDLVARASEETGDADGSSSALITARLDSVIAETVSSLAAQLGSSHEPLRDEAVEWLGNLDGASLHAIFRTMESGEQIACETAARAFHRLYTRDAWDIARLETLLASPHSETRRAAVRCLAHVTWEASAAVSRALEDVERERESGKELAGELVWLQRSRAVHDVAEKILLRLLRDVDSVVRQAAIEGLASSEHVSKGALDAVAGLLFDADEKVRDSALGILSMNDARVPLPIILRLLDSSRKDDRSGAISLLRKLGVDGLAAVPLLMEALDEHDPLRWEAIDALAAMGFRVLPELLVALSSERRSVRSGATLTIVRLVEGLPERTTGLRARAEALLPTIVQGLTFQDLGLWSASRDALDALGRGSPRGDEILLELLGDPRMARRLAAACILADRHDARPMVISALVPAARHDSELVRTAAVRALAAVRDMDPETVLPVLLDAVADRHSNGVARAAASALASWRSRAQDVAPGLLRAFRENHFPEVSRTAFSALVGFHRGNAPAIAGLFLEGLAHPDAKVRHDASFLCQTFRTELKAAEPILIEALPEAPEIVLSQLLIVMVFMLRMDLEPVAPILFDRLRRASEEDTRSALVMAIAAVACGSERVKSSVLEALREEKLRLSMIRVLGRMGSTAADVAPILRRVGRSSDVEVQHAVACALERIEAPKP